MSEGAPIAAPAEADVLLRLDDVHVRYGTYTDPARTSLGTAFLRGGRRRQRREVHAVRGVTVRLHRGERLAIVGSNGSGKSTLLRVMAGLQRPTDGEALARTYPVLLGIQAALNPRLSGSRNVFLGCTALGMRGRDARAATPAIIEFAGLADAADRPMRTYSAGMRARLQFAIATAVTPEVLLIDEALGAGDAAFRRRSRERIEELVEAAGGVVLVSHNMREVRQICERAVWMDAGRVVLDGDVDEVVDAYEARDGDG